MFKKNWEERWEKEGLLFASEIKDSVEDEWLQNFLQSSIILTNVSILTVITFIKEFKLKITEFDPKKFDKKLSKFKKDDIRFMFKLFLMDYIITFFDNPSNLAVLSLKNLTAKDFESQLLNGLKMNKKDKEIYKLLKDKKETFKHSITFFEKLNLGKDAKNHALLDGMEIIKEEVYNKLDNTFYKMIKPE